MRGWVGSLLLGIVWAAVPAIGIGQPDEPTGAEFPDSDCGFVVANPLAGFDPPGQALDGSRQLIYGPSCRLDPILEQPVQLVGLIGPSEARLGAIAVTSSVGGDRYTQGWWITPDGDTVRLGDPEPLLGTHPELDQYRNGMSLRVDGTHLVELCLPCEDGDECGYGVPCSCCRAYRVERLPDVPADARQIDRLARSSWRPEGREITARRLDTMETAWFTVRHREGRIPAGGSWNEWALAPFDSQPAVLELRDLIRAGDFGALLEAISRTALLASRSAEGDSEAWPQLRDEALARLESLTPAEGGAAQWEQCSRYLARHSPGYEPTEDGLGIFQACTQSIRRIALDSAWEEVDWCLDVAWREDGSLLCVRRMAEALEATACRAESCEPIPLPEGGRWRHPELPICAPFAAATVGWVELWIDYDQAGMSGYCTSSPPYDLCTSGFYARMDFGDSPPPPPSAADCAGEEASDLCYLYDDMHFQYRIGLPGLASDGPVWNSMYAAPGSAGHHPEHGYYSAVGPVGWWGRDGLLYARGNELYRVRLDGAGYAAVEAEVVPPALLAAAGFTADGRYRYHLSNRGGRYGAESSPSAWRIDRTTGESVWLVDATDHCEEAVESPFASILPSPSGEWIAVACGDVRVFRAPDSAPP